MVNDSNLKDHYHNKSVFVTGHTGFKGSWFCTILLSMGAKVKGYALDLAYDNSSLGYLLFVSNLHKNPSKFSYAFNFGPTDIDHLTVKTVVEKCIHFIKIGSWNDASSNSQLYSEANVLMLNIQKARNTLGWEPKLNSSEAIT